jgi:hypothetical protein
LAVRRGFPERRRHRTPGCRRGSGNRRTVGSDFPEAPAGAGLPAFLRDHFERPRAPCGAQRRPLPAYQPLAAVARCRRDRVLPVFPAWLESSPRLTVPFQCGDASRFGSEAFFCKHERCASFCRCELALARLCKTRQRCRDLSGTVSSEAGAGTHPPPPTHHERLFLGITVSPRKECLEIRGTGNSPILRFLGVACWGRKTT